MTRSDDVYSTQHLANAADAFVKVASERFPNDTFWQVVDARSLHRGYWQALQHALDAYRRSDNSVWTRGLMKGNVLAQPRIAGELLKVLLPDEVPNYSVVAEAWAAAMDAGPDVRALLVRESEVLFNLMGQELAHTAGIRGMLNHFAREYSNIWDNIWDKYSTQEADLVRLLDAALVSGPGALSLQVRHLLALAFERQADRSENTRLGLDVLVRLARYLPPDALLVVWRHVDHIPASDLRLRLTGQLVPHLSRAGLIDDPLAMILTTRDSLAPSPDPAVVVEVLLALAPHLAATGGEESLPSFQERVLAAVREIDDPASRLRAMGALIQNLPTTLQDETVSMAFETATNLISGEAAQANALSTLTAYLPPDGLERLFTIAGQFQKPDARAMVLGRMIPYVSPELRVQALVGSLKAIEQINGDEARMQSLIGLTPQLHVMGALGHYPEALQRALSALFSIARLDDRARAFAALAPYLAPELITEALQAVKTISDEHDRASTLVQLAPYLSDALLVTAFVMAQELTIADRRAAALAAIAPYLQPPARQQALGLALAAALAVRHRYNRVEVLVDLAPHLPDELKDRAMQDALTASRSIPNEYERARALVFLAPHLLAHQYADAVADAYTIHDQLEQVSVLSALVPYLPPEPAAQVGVDMIRKARALGDMRKKAGILSAIAPVLPSELVHEAAQVAQLIDSPFERMHVFAALLPRNPEQLYAAALEAARAVPAPFERVNALLELALYVPVAQRQRILDEALDTAVHITDDYDRASALASFGPYVSSSNELYDRQQDGLRLALDSCFEIRDRARRAEWLARVAQAWVELLPSGQAYNLWRRVMFFLREESYSEVMAVLVALLPVIQHMSAPGVMEDITAALLSHVAGDEFAPG